MARPAKRSQPSEPNIAARRVGLEPGTYALKHPNGESFFDDPSKLDELLGATARTDHDRRLDSLISKEQALLDKAKNITNDWFNELVAHVLERNPCVQEAIVSREPVQTHELMKTVWLEEQLQEEAIRDDLSSYCIHQLVDPTTDLGQQVHCYTHGVVDLLLQMHEKEHAPGKPDKVVNGDVDETLASTYLSQRAE